LQLQVTSSHGPCDASWQDRFVSMMTYKPSKLGQTVLVFGL